MPDPRKYRLTILLAVAVLAIFLQTGTALADAQDQDWQADLRQQLLDRHDCQLNYLTGARTFELLGRLTIKARAHCTNKQAFDVTRSGQQKAFDIRSCSTIEC